VRFGGLTALENVDVDLAAGEILGLIGPNGAGKTTLVNVLSGFQKPTEGEVRVGDLLLSGLPPRRITAAGVARTFQAARLFGDLTVRENVEVASLAAGRSSHAARIQAEELLEWVGCIHCAKERASELPYGRERLVGIARALATSPTFLLLDEPAAGLDEQEGRELAAFIQRVPTDQGCGVLLIEHNVELVLGVCRRVQVLDEGRTIALGAPNQIASDVAVRRAYLG